MTKETTINCDYISKFKFNPSKYTILIVEDSKSINKLIFTYFTQKGFNCISTTTIKEAKEVIHNTNIDINYIMLDINLPDGHGSEIIELLKNSKEKIFVLTSEDNVQFKNKVFEKGVIDYITKDKDFIYKFEQIEDSIKCLENNKFKTILVVDDSKTIQLQLQDILNNRNYKVETTDNTKDALEIIDTKIIDLILLDVELNSENGIDFLAQHKTTIINQKKIPVMIISGNVDRSIIRDSFKAGAVDVLRKPYVLEELILKVDMWVDYKRKEYEVKCSSKLLEEYKDAVDESSIVSKASPNGVITYVNKQFCELSGYSEDELIGKNHNIVRHSDMSKEAFQDMWYTIKELKQTWKGKVKNKKKDGSYYWVEAIIKPIIDASGQIVEFIGLRYDITDLETYKEILKDKLTDTNNTLKENLKYTSQYEDAINQFTAVLKTDTNNIITFANEEFCKLSGFTLEELKGKNCEELRDKKHIKNNDCKNIAQKLKNKEIVTIQFTNISKENKPYYVDTIVYPILDLDDNLKEQLHLMHDITDIIELHKEIEETQKDIVYKMGEIGETRSKETGHHVKRVAEYSKTLALLYGLEEKEAETIFTASPMHDIGKVGIPDEILKKPGPLSDEEFSTMKKHAEIGYNVLQGSNRNVLKAAAIVAYEHHERWDGKGYPKGLAKEDIHIYGRITAVADVFDALGSDRCYKKAWDDEKIFKLFEEEKGKQFDPVLIELFLNNKEKFIEIRDKYKD